MLDMVWYIPLDNQEVIDCVAEELKKVSSEHFRDLFNCYWAEWVADKTAN